MDKSSSQHGFTLWELLCTVAVAGIVLGLGVPSFMEFQRNNAMTGAANELVGAVLAARAEAVKRQAPVTLCASAAPTADPPVCNPDGAGANGGFILWVDENGNGDLTDATDGNAVVDTGAGELVLLQRPAPGGTIDVWGENGYITFGPNGFPREVAGLGAPVTRVLYCDDRGNRAIAAGLSAARVVRIEATGRAQVLREIPDVTNALATITAAGVAAACP